MVSALLVGAGQVQVPPGPPGSEQVHAHPGSLGPGQVQVPPGPPCQLKACLQTGQRGVLETPSCPVVLPERRPHRACPSRSRGTCERT